MINSLIYKLIHMFTLGYRHDFYFTHEKFWFCAPPKVYFLTISLVQGIALHAWVQATLVNDEAPTTNIDIDLV